MSFYNTIFGVNNAASAVLEALGFEESQVPRFRDAYVIKEGHLCIYTRTGGGNRDFYDNEQSCREFEDTYDFVNIDDGERYNGPFNSDLRAHRWYVDDYDDDFDSTYATFVFKPEGDLPVRLAEVYGYSMSGEDKWNHFFEWLDAETVTK